ncbi:MAG: rhodanese-like domain-containing protein, partial [Micrococcales bacterium]|nr:rhodanese-like domain-containing protein [Micrococcales bacterium]
THIPLGELESRRGELPQERPIVVACRSGARSARAVAFLRGQGYDAFNLTGGMLAWQQGSRPMSHDGPGAPSVA